MFTGNRDELARLTHDNATLRRHGGDRHPTPPAELKQTFVAQRTQRPQNRVGIHAENRREIPSRGKPLARASLAFRDRATDRRSYLLVQRNRTSRV